MIRLHDETIALIMRLETFDKIKIGDIVKCYISEIFGSDYKAIVTRKYVDVCRIEIIRIEDGFCSVVSPEFLTKIEDKNG